MKNFPVICLLCFIVAFKSAAQAPQGIPYQAAVRNAAGLPLSNRSIKVRFTVIENTALGTTVYKEAHAVTTTALGLFSLNVGMGTPSQGLFSNINWASSTKFLKVELDTTGSSGNYIDLGTQQMMSVPYALHANNGLPSGAGQGQTLTYCDGLPIWTSGGLCPAKITSLACSSATNNGTLTNGIAASGVTSVVPYTGGNGGVYSAIIASSTGVTGLTALLSAGTLANGTGTLTYSISGTPATSGTASFGLSLGGKTCTLTRNVNLAAVVTALACSSATNNGTLASGVSASGVSSVIAYTGGNGGIYTAQSITSTGVTGLTANLAAGTLASGSGTITYSITGTPASAGTANFAINFGGQSCTLSRTVVLPVGVITSLTCASATNSGNLYQGTAASSVSSSVPYTGGNGGTHSGQTVSSTGVTGLTATLASGTFATGAGNLTYTITGTPSASGTASFALNIGGQTCTLSRTVNITLGTYPAGQVYCTGSATTVVNVTNPTTGKVWMDRNLGATQVATSSTDANAYGDLYQWGRGVDGHQCRSSATTTTLSSSNQPGNASFIMTSASPNDWRSSPNDSLWQSVNGINNPCPSGYRLPTESELIAERATWSSQTSAGALSSPIKLPLPGSRSASSGSIVVAGSIGYYWTGTVSFYNAQGFVLSSSSANTTSYGRANGLSVRCIRD